MRQRNWIDLSRKLVDRFDLNFTLSGMSEILGKYALTFFGEGVKITTEFPNPFPIVLSGANLTGTVGPGIGYDKDGNYTSIPSATGLFTITAGNVSLPRRDLLVIRYKQTGDTLIPKPSDPITMVDLNLHDDFELLVIPGTPNAIPVYPAKNAQDIILAGLLVPSGATIANQCTVDLSVREFGFSDVAKYPVFKQELLTGVIDGVNTVFTISLEPVTNSILLTTDGLSDKISDEYSISGTTITFTEAPVPGRPLYAWFVVMDASSTNPLAAFQESPVGTIDGVNDTFSFTGNPASKDSTVIFINGRLITSDGWSLIQTPTGSQIKFLPGSIPQIAQTIYSFYFVNPATVGVAPSGPGVGGLIVYGSEGSPIIVNPAVGVLSPTDPRSLQFLSAAAPDSVVTANPQISPGTDIGQEQIITGTSDVNYPTFNNGNGMILNGPLKLKLDMTCSMFWTGTNWKENSRT